ncbi:hypothetical protein C4573_05050 [Candidatus Woesearchaeota archaeon]|nr:MAG: hypothetical protein C4573_05050 [Candidatus Woesearchaeota archaeon]
MKQPLKKTLCVIALLGATAGGVALDKGAAFLTMQNVAAMKTEKAALQLKYDALSSGYERLHGQYRYFVESMPNWDPTAAWIGGNYEEWMIHDINAKYKAFPH